MSKKTKHTNSPKMRCIKLNVVPPKKAVILVDVGYIPLEKKDQKSE